MGRLAKILGVIAVLTVVAIVVSKHAATPRGGKVVAIATLMAHPALDAVQRNLVKELERQGFVEGKNVRYVVRNANGQVQLASNIANELSAQGSDVIVAITTPMAQAVAKSARGPVVFAAVTDPVGAGLISSVDKGEVLITGTSDAWPYEDQLKLIRKITPAVKRLGVLYNPGEAASQFGIKEIRRFAPSLGFELIEGAASSTNDVYPVAQNLVGRVDALFLSSDNTVIGGVAAAVKVAVEHRIPLYVGDSGTVEKGGLAAVSVGYSELGTETGRLVARMLNGERSIPAVVARGSEVYLNKKAAELMGVSIPTEVLQSATKVYDEIAK
ncbi:MAG: ABC transporter substrate-binding protein [Planctomycetota bacterium]|nr:ABC transporter substrate-binding protein [Planctomycetota bacterium]